MASQIGWGRKDETSYGTAGAFDNSQFGQGQNGIDKVTWLQKQMYANESANAAKQIKDKRAFDGKFGQTTKAWFDKQGWQVSDGGDTLTRAGHTYRWDPTRKEYVEHVSSAPQRDPDEELLYGLSDGRQREVYRWLDRNPGKTIKDWFNLQGNIHNGNQGLVRVGAQSGQFVMEDEMSAATAAAAKGDHHTATTQKGVRSTVNGDRQWTNPGKNNRVRLTQKDTVGRGGTQGKQGNGYTEYEAQNVTDGKLYRYNAGQTRQGKKVGGQYSTEGPVIWTNTNAGASTMSPFINTLDYADNAEGDYNTMQNMPGQGVATVGEYILNGKGDPSAKSTTQTVYQRGKNTYFPEKTEYVASDETYANSPVMKAVKGVGNGIKGFFSWLTDVKPRPHVAGRKNGGKLVPKNYK